MVGQTGRNGRGTLDPTMTIIADRQFQAQAVMEITKVVETAHEIHACGEGFGSTSQSTSAADQVVQTLPEGGVEAFDEGGVDHAFGLLRDSDQALDHFLGALHNTSVNRQDAFCHRQRHPVGPFLRLDLDLVCLHLL